MLRCILPYSKVKKILYLKQGDGNYTILTLFYFVFCQVSVSLRQKTRNHENHQRTKDHTEI